MVGEKVYNSVLLKDSLMSKYSLDDVLKDQECFVRKVLNDADIAWLFKGEPEELTEAVYRESLAGIKAGIDHFITLESQNSTGNRSKNIFDYDIAKFYYEVDMKTPVEERLVQNQTVKKYFHDEGSNSHQNYCETISLHMHREYRHHVFKVDLEEATLYSPDQKS